MTTPRRPPAAPARRRPGAPATPAKKPAAPRRRAKPASRAARQRAASAAPPKKASASAPSAAPKAAAATATPPTPPPRPLRAARPAAPAPRAARLVDRRRAAEIIDRLLEHHPDGQSALVARNPFELLAATILSAQCTDARVNLVTPDLFAAFPDAAAMAAADEAELRRLIYSTGFHNQKAASLRRMSADLVAKHGGAVPGTLEELTALRGVGRKTAWCVLGAWFGRHGIIVDTHLERVTRRLGLHDQHDPRKIEAALDRLVDEPRRTAFSHAIQVVGRGPCAARRTRCAACFLADLCPSAEAGAA